MSIQSPVPSSRSWWSRTFGRSVYGIIFGNNLADRNVAATVIGIMLVATLCWLAITGKANLSGDLVNIVFVVVGFYFGSKRVQATDCDDAE